jgi:hypothetical protein
MGGLVGWVGGSILQLVSRSYIRRGKNYFQINKLFSRLPFLLLLFPFDTFIENVHTLFFVVLFCCCCCCLVLPTGRRDGRLGWRRLVSARVTARWNIPGAPYRRHKKESKRGKKEEEKGKKKLFRTTTTTYIRA